MNKLPVNTIAIVGIHTGIGKTIAAAVIAEALGADYWKPVQAGVEERDMLTVQGLLTDGKDRVHPEAVVLQRPASPHAAAADEGIDIDFTKFVWPVTGDLLLVETAGGVLSPMSATTTMADFVSHFRLPVILVTQNYLGSINHTLLSIETLRTRGIHILGVVMNGKTDEASESFIEQYAGVKIIARIPQFKAPDNSLVSNCALSLKDSLRQLLITASL